MYIPKHFAAADLPTVYDFIDKHSFGIIFSNHQGVPVATHLPLLLDRENDCLAGHFAKANPQWKDIAGQDVLVVLQGPHSYISPSWYETNQAVPTWNYIAVHVYGEFVPVEDPEELFGDLKKMVRKYEGPTGPYDIDESNEEFTRGLMSGIVGFKIKINRIEGKWKLSQNHPKERQERIISHLERVGTDHAEQIASAMKEISDSKIGER